jgi:hypothetical protein
MFVKTYNFAFVGALYDAHNEKIAEVMIDRKMIFHFFLTNPDKQFYSERFDGKLSVLRFKSVTTGIYTCRRLIGGYAGLSH